jgi:glycosyltransferase involved in cell wall biosynthesis
VAIRRSAKPQVNPSGETTEPAQKPERVQEEPLGPRVSAILVAFNQAPALRRAIQALEKSQDRERLEILVVDCGSQDESSTLDADYPAINLLRLPHHLGATRAMNIGTRTAKADLVFYLSPDVEVEPGTVKALADRLEPDADAAAVCPLLVDPEGQPASHVHTLPDRAALTAASRGNELPAVSLDLSQESIDVAYPGVEAILIRKQFVRSMNYFDERYGHYWADLDLAMQVRRATKKIRLYPAIHAVYHPAPDPLDGEPLAEADRITGAAAFLGKYQGFAAGLGFRLGAAFSALGRFDLGQMAKVLGGQKLDGSQAA